MFPWGLGPVPMTPWGDWRTSPRTEGRLRDAPFWRSKSPDDWPITACLHQWVDYSYDQSRLGLSLGSTWQDAEKPNHIFRGLSTAELFFDGWLIFWTNRSWTGYGWTTVIHTGWTANNRSQQVGITPKEYSITTFLLGTIIPQSLGIYTFYWIEWRSVMKHHILPISYVKMSLIMEIRDLS